MMCEVILYAKLILVASFKRRLYFVIWQVNRNFEIRPFAAPLVKSLLKGRQV
jgi:hypothetical protein